MDRRGRREDPDHHELRFLTYRFCIPRAKEACAAIPRPLMLVVRWGRDRRRSFRRHPHVAIEHLAESVAAECGVPEPDFRNRYEEKPTYSSV